MKKHLILSFVGATLFIANVNSTATPLGGNYDGLKSLIGVSEMDGWQYGVYVRGYERDVKLDGLLSDTTLEFQSLMGYVGYDLVNWITAYGTAGISESKFGTLEKGDSESEVGFGMNFNLLSTDLLEPSLMEDSIQVSAGWQLTFSEAELVGRSLDWTEFMASLTVSIVNELEGNKLFMPEAIALFGGPVYSNIEGDDIDEKDQIGFTAGLEIFCSERISVDLRIYNFDEITPSGGLHIRF